MLETLWVGAAEGVVRGGWEYVWTAWGLTWFALGAYAVVLFVRSRKG